MGSYLVRKLPESSRNGCAMRNNVIWLVAFITTIWCSNLTAGCTDGHKCHFCRKHCCAEHLVKKTIKVPITVVEMRVKSCIVQKKEQREETYTVFERVPVKQRFDKEICYLADEVKTKEITQTQCKRVKVPVVRTYAVNVPTKELREVNNGGGTCSNCCNTCQQKPCVCEVTRYHRETRESACEREQVVFETTKRKIDYCVKVPKTKKEFCSEESTFKLVPVEKKRTVEVCVPKIEKHPVEVLVKKMATKVVYCCEPCWKRHRHN